MYNISSPTDVQITGYDGHYIPVILWYTNQSLRWQKSVNEIYKEAVRERGANALNHFLEQLEMNYCMLLLVNPEENTFALITICPEICPIRGQGNPKFANKMPPWFDDEY